jgi:hypothetical protein
MVSTQLSALATGVAAATATYVDLVAAAGPLAYPGGFLLFGLLLWALVQVASRAAVGR